jgi:tetratricopeptide (TPR) repeat protein
MRIPMVAFGAAACVMVASLVPFSAEAANDEDVCDNAQGNKGIAACTRVVASSRVRGHRQAVAYYNRGVDYTGMGQRARAIADYSKAIRLDPKYAEPYNNRGYLYIETHSDRRARRDLNTAIRLDPRYQDAYVNRAKTYLGAGDGKHALADLNTAVRLDPRDWIAYYDRGVLRRVLGDDAGSKADLAKAKRLKRGSGSRR